jgi:hypothetical protein
MNEMTMKMRVSVHWIKLYFLLTYCYEVCLSLTQLHWFYSITCNNCAPKGEGKDFYDLSYCFTLCYDVQQSKWQDRQMCLRFHICKMIFICVSTFSFVLKMRLKNQVTSALSTNWASISTIMTLNFIDSFLFDVVYQARTE